MVENSDLEDVVLKVLNKHAQQDPGFAAMSEGDEDLGKKLIKEVGQVQVDEAYKLRMMFGSFIGYGYDFRKADFAQKMYENAVSKTKQLSGVLHFETLVDNGINDEIGWYVTKI